MSRVAVVTDSAADLPRDVAERRGIRVVPLTVAFGEEQLLDGAELEAGAFWRRMESESTLPTTASPSPEALVEAYRSAADDGAEAVVSIHLSARLSRTGDTAAMAASRAGLPVEVIDSRSVCAGQALVALAAADAAAGNADLAAVAERARTAAAALRMAAAIDTVEYLKRGGRVGAVAAALSGLLRVRPVLSLDEGVPVLVSRARTRTRAVEEILKRTTVRGRAAAVFHSGAPEAKEVARRIAETCGVEPLEGWIGAVTGTHLGPRAIAVAVLPA